MQGQSGTTLLSAYADETSSRLHLKGATPSKVIDAGSIIVTSKTSVPRIATDITPLLPKLKGLGHVKELLGHKTLSMTLRFAHLAPSHKLKAVNILDGAINQAAETAPSRKPTIQKLYNPTFLAKKEVSL